MLKSNKVQYKNFKSVKDLLDEFKCSLYNVDVRTSVISGSILPKKLNQDKISADTYLKWAQDDLKKIKLRHGLVQF